MSIFQHTGVRALFCITILLLLIQIAISPNSARADGDTIHLKNGGFITGQLMEVLPEQYATIRLADETVRKIEWAEIDRVERAPEQPPEPASEQQPEATTPEPVEPILPAPQTEYEERTRTGVPGLYIPGFIVFGVSWVLTLVICPTVSRENDPDEDDYDSNLDEAKGIDVVSSLIPVVGPWIGFVSDESRVPRELWVLSGVTQGVGLAMAIAGLTLERKQSVPVYKGVKSYGIKAAYLTPEIMGYGSAGLSLKLIHY